MNTKEIAVQDIKEELKSQGKSFIAFRKELNPTIRKLVSKWIKNQTSSSPFNSSFHSNAQLIAKCFFCKNTGSVELINYSRYYQDNQVSQVKD